MCESFSVWLFLCPSPPIPITKVRPILYKEAQESIGYPEWTLMNLGFGLSLRPYEEG